jgi:hypothetical protein
MIYLSTAQSFWFSLNSSYDHDFHLSQRFGMTAHSYECLLVAANLAVFHKSWGFTIKILQYFITSNSIGSFDVDTKKIDLCLHQWNKTYKGYGQDSHDSNWHSASQFSQKN